MTASAPARPASPVEAAAATQAARALRGVARGGVLSLAGSVAAAAAGLAVTWLAARALPPDEAGVLFATTAAFVLAVTVAKLGTQTGLVYWTARVRALKQRHLLSELLRTALTPVAVASVLASIAVWWAAPRLAAVAASADAAGYERQLRVLALFLPLAAMSDSVLAATRGFRRIRPTVYIDRLLRPGLQLLAFGTVAVLVLAGLTPPDLTAFSVAWVAPYVPAAALAALALRRILATGGGLPSPEAADDEIAVEWRSSRGKALLPDGARVRWRFWRFTGPRALAGVGQTALQRIDVVLVASLAGFQAAAVYSVAGRFVLVAQLANQAISQSVQPRLAELLTAELAVPQRRSVPGQGAIWRSAAAFGEQRAAARTLYQSATAWLVLLAWPPCLLVAVFAPAYLRLFGHGYVRGAGIVVVLAVAMLIATACGMVDMVLSMAGRTSWNLGNVALALAVMVGLDLLLIPWLGAFGAALGLAAAILTNNLVPLAQIARLLRLHPFGRGTIAAAGLATACFALAPLALLAVGLPAGMALLCSIGLGPPAYALGCWCLRDPLGLHAFRRVRRGEPVEST
jgi:O-antigen/teichoic acid export membrane protein